MVLQMAALSLGPYLPCGAAGPPFMAGRSGAAHSTERLTQRLLEGLHSRQWALQGQLVTGVQCAPGGRGKSRQAISTTGPGGPHHVSVLSPRGPAHLTKTWRRCW